MLKVKNIIRKMALGFYLLPAAEFIGYRTNVAYQYFHFIVNPIVPAHFYFDDIFSCSLTFLLN